MSYDVYLVDAVTGSTLELPEVHNIAGGIRLLNGTSECWLNVTYNYSRFFYDNFPKDTGLRWLYGKTGQDSLPVLESIIAKLIPDEGGYDYWASTEGNARRALEGLLVFAKAHPNGVWKGD